MSLKVFLPSLLVLALSACAVGPDYKTPTCLLYTSDAADE